VKVSALCMRLRNLLNFHFDITCMIINYFRFSNLVSKCPMIQRSSRFIKTQISSPNCFNTQLNVGQTCSFDCEPWFKYSQLLIECLPGTLAVGKWSIDLDKTPPTCTGTIKSFFFPRLIFC